MDRLRKREGGDIQARVAAHPFNLANARFVASAVFVYRRERDPERARSVVENSASFQKNLKKDFGGLLGRRRG